MAGGFPRGHSAALPNGGGSRSLPFGGPVADCRRSPPRGQWQFRCGRWGEHPIGSWTCQPRLLCYESNPRSFFPTPRSHQTAWSYRFGALLCRGVLLCADASKLRAGGWQPGGHRCGRAHRATGLPGSDDCWIGAIFVVAPDCNRLQEHERNCPEAGRLAGAGDLHPSAG